jgi:hypothetical protein
VPIYGQLAVTCRRCESFRACASSRSRPPCPTAQWQRPGPAHCAWPERFASCNGRWPHRSLTLTLAPAVSHNKRTTSAWPPAAARLKKGLDFVHVAFECGRDKTIGLGAGRARSIPMRRPACPRVLGAPRPIRPLFESAPCIPACSVAPPDHRPPPPWGSNCCWRRGGV